MKVFKNIIHVIFAVTVLVICSIPLWGMIWAPTMTTTENRTLASFPTLMEDGKINTDYLPELGTYFNDHYAGKNELVAVDSQIQSQVFHVSSVSTILVGENDWLYYTDSLDDYLGQNVVTERGAHNIVRNIALMQEKVESEGGQFLFTIAPNKNSLYDENMPEQYQVKASETSNVDLVTAELAKQEVPYADLYTAFRSQDEILYCSQDSHWNQKGAVLAYTTIREALGRKAVDYNEKADVVHTKLEAGDLAIALYSINAEPEWNYRYDFKNKAKFQGDAESWEDSWIETKNKKAKKKTSLLMFRDSFGISLAPYVAEDYRKAAFSRNSVYMLDTYMEKVEPKDVIVEIVERNLDRFGVFDEQMQQASGPAVMAGVASDADISQAAAAEESLMAATQIRCSESMLLPSYEMITGSVDEALLDVDTNIWLQVKDGDDVKLYPAFNVSSQGKEAGTWKDNGFLLYLDKEELLTDALEVTVLTENDGAFTIVGSGTCMVEEEIYE